MPTDSPPPRFSHRLVVRYADTDAQGHVYFANYLTFMDEALTGYLMAIGVPPKHLVDDLGVDFVFASVEVDYRGSSRFQDPLDIGVRVTRVGNTSFTVECVVQRVTGDAGSPPELLASGTLVQVCVDAATHRPVPVPDPLRGAIARFEGTRP